MKLSKRQLLKNKPVLCSDAVVFYIFFFPWSYATTTTNYSSCMLLILLTSGFRSGNPVGRLTLIHAHALTRRLQTHTHTRCKKPNVRAHCEPVARVCNNVCDDLSRRLSRPPRAEPPAVSADPHSFFISPQ